MPNDGENAYARAARIYRSLGWLGTLPLPPGMKESPPSGYTGHGRPYPDDKQVKAWIASGPRNLALRLGDLAGYVPKGEMPCGWELLGIDVDTYGDKDGIAQLRLLEEKYGKLPPTVRSSSRWPVCPPSAQPGWYKQPELWGDSYIAVFLVPTGFRFMGKAASCIEIVQKAHRYMLAWPSRNPDAKMAVYRWKRPDGAYYDVTDEGDARPDEECVPPLDDVAVLPLEWFNYLSNNGTEECDVPISDMTGEEMYFWAVDTFRDSDGPPCKLMQQQLDRQIEKMKRAPDSHPNLTNAHWELINLAAEGHSGWLKAVQQYNAIWLKLAGEKRDALPDPNEVTRSAFGAISKVEPVVNSEERNGYIAEDRCSDGNNVFDVNEWGYQTDDEQVAALDYKGLGPVVGKVATYQTKPSDQYPMNDRGNGQHFVDLYQDDVKFVDSRRSWVLWDGERWWRDLDDKLVGKAYSRVEQLQTKFAAELPRGDDTQIRKAEAWRKWGVRSGNVPVIKNALTIAKGLDVGDIPVALSGKEFDSNPMLLGCANGILDLTCSDLGVRPPQKQDYVTYNTKVPYIPWDTDAAHQSGLLEQYKLWTEYLEIFQPDPEMRLFVQKVLGHLLVGENPEKLIIFVYGEHDTGKSTLLGGLSGALGDYYGTIDINLFRNKELNPQLIRAVPLRVTGMSEVDAGRMDASTMKRLTGNDKVVAEAKYSNDIFEGRPQFTTLIACNNEPEIQHSDEALRERVLILPFETIISRSMRQYEKQTEIERHSGIAVLAWLVEGWKLYCEQGLQRKDWPSEVKRLCGEVVSHFNATQTFIAECLEKYRDTKDGGRAYGRAKQRAANRGKPMPGPTDWDKEWTPRAGAVYERYTRWCSANGIGSPVSSQQLGKDIGMGRTQQRNMDGDTSKVYVGVRFRES